MDLGEFEAAVRGAVDLDIYGTALSYSFEDEDRFDVSFKRQGVNYAGFVSFRVDGTERAEGVYPVGPGPGEVRIVYDVDTRTDQEFVATGGALTILEVRESDLTGSFAFEAEDADGASVTVEGTFRADRRDVPAPTVG